MDFSTLKGKVHIDPTRTVTLYYIQKENQLEAIVTKKEGIPEVLSPPPYDNEGNYLSPLGLSQDRISPDGDYILRIDDEVTVMQRHDQCMEGSSLGKIVSIENVPGQVFAAIDAEFRNGYDSYIQAKKSIRSKYSTAKIQIMETKERLKNRLLKINLEMNELDKRLQEIFPNAPGSDVLRGAYYILLSSQDKLPEDCKRQLTRITREYQLIRDKIGNLESKYKAEDRQMNDKLNKLRKPRLINVINKYR